MYINISLLCSFAGCIARIWSTAGLQIWTASSAYFTNSMLIMQIKTINCLFLTFRFLLQERNSGTSFIPDLARAMIYSLSKQQLRYSPGKLLYPAGSAFATATKINYFILLYC